MSTEVALNTTTPHGPSEISDIPNPIPMSFPAVLRSSKITDRFAHLRIASASSEPVPVVGLKAKKNNREDREGKRWVRRKENARFAGNPHIVIATKGDYSLTLPTVKATFPEPLPPYLPRNPSVSSISPQTPPDSNSSNAGRFSLSLKGMRRELRKSGSQSQHLVRDVESEIVAWLQDGRALLSPDNKDNAFNFPGAPIGDTGSVYEVGRTPLQLVWSITDNAFARYIVHCCARYHGVVSFSKYVDGQRLTYLLRPNVTRPDHSAVASVDTPPPTDYSSQGDLESDLEFTSDGETLESSIEAQRPQSTLSSISETSPSTHQYRYRAAPAGEQSDDEWSILDGDTEADADLSGSEYRNSDPVTIAEESGQQEFDVDQTPRANQGFRNLLGYTRHSVRQSPLSRVWERRNRANSSPSRSPARRPLRRRVTRANPPKAQVSNSFYEYLFSDHAG